MNKKILVGTIASTIILGGALGAGAMTDNFRTVGINTEQTAASNTSTESKVMTMEEAKKLALAEYNGVIESIELDKEWRKDIYEIEIKDGVMEYDIDLDAETGEFLKVKEEKDDDGDDDRSEDATNVKEEDLITEEKAIEIATKEVPGTVNKVERDHDDNRVEYDIEVQTDKGETDIEIDAETGEILSIDHDRD
ncbi:PepSY domain-containing protein [Jeotgalibacillus sp. S-D1]|uniref:PepSY domain-containing protein n=1 Tax=Jeotgalibacillus sp. S-D1 TaxID=2552189 RepID=UPI0014045105|nr:PepSY domain-containing protein [Jeotgalibacillus sp. S-D1]